MSAKRLSVHAGSRRTAVDWKQRYDELKRERDLLVRDLVQLQAEREEQVRVADHLLGAAYCVDITDDCRS